MSYTLTINEPKAAAWFEETSRTMTPSELGALFVVFLRQHVNRPASFAEKWRAAVRKSSGRLSAPVADATAVAGSSRIAGTYAIDFKKLDLPVDRGEATVKAEIVTE